jgi:NAD(P) transhydrogenase subunit alpha
MMKENVIKIDWTDEVLAKTVLTHEGEIKNAGAKRSTPESKAA